MQYLDCNDWNFLSRVSCLFLDLDLESILVLILHKWLIFFSITRSNDLSLFRLLVEAIIEFESKLTSITLLLHYFTIFKSIFWTNFLWNNRNPKINTIRAHVFQSINMTIYFLAFQFLIIYYFLIIYFNKRQNRLIFQ